MEQVSTRETNKSKKNKRRRKMKHLNRNMLFSLLFACMLVFGLSQTAMAAGTASGTNVENKADVNFSVGGVPQTEVESAPGGNSTPGDGNGTATDFVVDNKVDVLVSVVDVASTKAGLSETDSITTFNVKNEGNATQDYSLAVANRSGGTADPHGGSNDNFDYINTCDTYVEDGTTPGSYQAGEDTATFIDGLAADADVDVYVLCDMPTAGLDGEIGVITLTATTRDASGSPGAITTETAGPDNEDSVDVVFDDDQTAGPAGTDGDDDGTDSDSSSYKLDTVSLTVTKTSTVYSDPVNGTSNPKRIPGAVVTYLITIVNNGAQAASVLSIDDDLDTLYSEIGNTIEFKAQFDDGTALGCAGTEGIAIDNDTGSFGCQSNADDGDFGDWNDTTANTVHAEGLSASASGGTVRLKYQVTIK